MWKYIGTGKNGAAGERIARSVAGQADPDAPCVALDYDGGFAVWGARPLLRDRDYPELRHMPAHPDKCPYPIMREKTPEQQQIALLEKELGDAQVRIVQEQARATALDTDLADAKAQIEKLEKSKG